MIESDTPRVDAGAEYWLEPGLRSECEIVNADFARILERELNAARDQIEKDFPPEPEYTAWVEAGKPDISKVVKERDEARKALIDMLSQTVLIGCDVWELPSCSTDEVNRWRKAAGSKVVLARKRG